MKGWSSLRDVAVAVGLVSRAAAQSVASHWSVAALSVFLAFGVWFVVTDVENPEVEGSFPPEGEAPLRVRYVNLSDEFVVAEQQTVSIVVEARERDFGSLDSDDFIATVNMMDVPEGRSTLPVTVSSSVDGVRVISVVPSEVSVEVQQAESKTVDVTVRPIGSLPSGVALEGGAQPVVEPATVVVSGLPQIIDQVDHVELPVDLTGRRSDFTVTGRLEAVTANGNLVTPRLSEPIGTVNYDLTAPQSLRVLPLVPIPRGNPAEGYTIAGVSITVPETSNGAASGIDPESGLIVVTGPENLLDSLTPTWPLAPVDVEGATQRVVQQREINLPEGLSSTVTTATVTIEIAPVGCTNLEDPAVPCSERTFLVAPRVSEIPPGLHIDAPSLQIPVRISGPLELLEQVNPIDDIGATISLAGASAGTATYPVAVQLNQGFDDLTVKEDQTISLTLVPAETETPAVTSTVPVPPVAP